MRTRAASSVLIVIVGLVATIRGGPAFALLFVCLGAAGYREYLQLAARIVRAPLGSFAPIGYGTIVGFGLVALLDATSEMLFAVASLAVVTPLVLLLRRPVGEVGLSAWSMVSIGSLYLGLPVYAAIAIRATNGYDVAAWLSELTSRLSSGWHAAPLGLAWALVVILTTWAGDTAAYSVGRAWGRRKFAPAVSPNKTVEGAAGGLVGSMVASALAFQSFGLGNWWQGLIVGGVIGIAGQTGDLAESLLKRQAGVKDSGAVIPGHGGILDRIDALLFAFPAGFVIAAGFERIAT